MTNLKVTITEVPDPLLPDNVIAVIDGTPIVAAGKSKQEVWKELITSLAITIAHNSGLDYKELTYELKDSPYQGSAGVWVKASERLPDTFWVGPVRFNHRKAHWTHGVRSGDQMVYAANLYEDLEWLDSAAAPAGDGWNLNMNEAPKDGTRIQAWHKLWECPISVKWVGDKIQHEKFPWVCVTLANTWPEEAFIAWRPLPSPPKTSV